MINYSKNQFVVYTAVFDNYDKVSKVDSSWNCDFICFTDNADLVATGWIIVLINIDNETGAISNRRYKMLPHKYLSDYKTSLYVDANIRILRDPSLLIRKYSKKSSLCFPAHQERKCAYAEAKVCIDTGRVDKDLAVVQMNRYESDGFPENFGLTENNIIIRNHNDPVVIKLMELWWFEYCKGVGRDQISLPYLMWKHCISYEQIVEGPRLSSKYFKVHFHKHSINKSLVSKYIMMVNYKKNKNIIYFCIASLINIIADFVGRKIRSR